MGGCQSGLTEEDLKRKSKNNELESMMALEAKAESDKVKLLLLGAGELVDPPAHPLSTVTRAAAPTTAAAVELRRLPIIERTPGWLRDRRRSPVSDQKLCSAAGKAPVRTSDA